MARNLPLVLTLVLISSLCLLAYWSAADDSAGRSSSSQEPAADPAFEGDLAFDANGHSATSDSSLEGAAPHSESGDASTPPRRRSRYRRGNFEGGDLEGGGTAGAGRSSSASGSSSRSQADRDEVDRSRKLGSARGLLEGEALTAALQDLRAEEDLGPLQALLISEMTKNGTLFTEEQVPDLFDTLLEIDDFGLQKLVLTHLERIEGSPEALVDGYLDYLAEARKPAHADDVFEQIGKLGGEAAVSGLSDILRDHESSKTRVQAADTLAQIKDARGVDAIRDALRGNDLADSRSGMEARGLMDALSNFEGRQALDVMIDFASQEGHEDTLGAFRKMKNQELAGALADSLRDRSSEAYSRMAVKKLGEFGDPDTVPSLARHLDRATGRHQKDVLSALGRFRDVGAARALESFARESGDPVLSRLAQHYSERVLKRSAEPPRSTHPARATSKKLR